jgi:photosystem II stability/assembly factor-like uncharacterized protein
MEGDVRRSRKSLVAASGVGLIATFIAGTIAVGWHTETDVVSVVRLRSGPIDASTVSSVQGSGQWIPFGAEPFLVSNTLVPTPESYRTYNSGRVSSIAVDPRDPSRWLLGVGNGGVWETRDAGGAWTPITDDAPTLATGAIAFAPSNPDVVYVGTGEGYPFSSHARVGLGLLKSTNGGQSWALLGQTSLARGAIRRLRVDPADANVLLVALMGATFGRDGNGNTPAPPSYGVLRSTDGGATWTRTLGGIPTALEVDPRSFSRQYAAIAIGGNNGVYRSTNGGVTWSRIDGPWWSNPSDYSGLANGRIELAIAPSNPDVVYAGIAESIGSPRRGSLLGLFRTDNAWSDAPNWIQIPIGATGPGGYCATPPTAPPKCDYSHVISVDPRDPNTLFAGGAWDLWRCTNCGASPAWTNTTSERRFVFVHVDFHALAWAGNRLITGNDGGVFSTTDFGATWQDHNRSLATNMFCMGALHPTDPVFTLGGPRDFGWVTYRSGLGWRKQMGQGGEGDIALSSARPETDWMGVTGPGAIFRTTDGSRTTLQVDAGIDKTGKAGTSLMPVRKCPTNDDIFLVGTVLVWRTDNFFNSTMPSWRANSPDRPFPTPGFNSFNEPGTIQTINFVAADRSCNTYAYGTRGGEVRFTRDGGATWADFDPSKTLPARPINSIAFDPTNANRAFVAVSSYDLATPTKAGHIFLTENALSSFPTWTRVGPPDQPFADVPFNVIAIDPRDTRLVYAGSDNGLWASSDGGATFAKVGREAGLPPAAVHDIQINPTTNRTVLFTYGRGAFELAR